MSVFTIKNKFLDPYDPFWICRVLSLKMGTVVILLFLCNAFLMSPASPVSYILTTLVGTSAAEMLPTNSRWKKIGALYGIVLTLAIPSTLFGLFSYFRVGLFVLVFAFTYFALRFMAKNPKAAAIPVTMIVWGVMQLAGGASTNFVDVMNEYFYYFEFALMGALAIIFFPNFTPYVYKSAFIRILEHDIQNIGDKGCKNSDALVLGALSMMRSKLPLLPESYTALYQAVIHFQHECMGSKLEDAQEQRLVKSILFSLVDAVSRKLAFSDVHDHLDELRTRNRLASTSLGRMIEGYEQCRV